MMAKEVASQILAENRKICAGFWAKSAIFLGKTPIFWENSPKLGLSLPYSGILCQNLG